ncbi:unnamed protein product [Haemonchus placei]|uniref:Ion_trans domain-containing protein n=1 Tax=Haemonchus placei TaxID=6290 RepID=A0A0N4W0D8_HAEPC|nr:unnamed protein product [Haemonchus placei]
MVAIHSSGPRIDQVLFCLELSWSNSFEGFKLHFTPGAALLMLLVDIIWMNMATLLFDSMFSDSDFTLFRLPSGKKVVLYFRFLAFSIFLQLTSKG